MKQKGFAGIIILIIALILAGLGGAYYFGTIKNNQPESKPDIVTNQDSPQPTINAQVIISENQKENSKSTKITQSNASPEQDSESPTVNIRKIEYNALLPIYLIEFKSAVGYSFQYNKDLLKTQEKMINQFGINTCIIYLNNNVGGTLTAQVVPYSGGSRRELFFSVYPYSKEGYTHAFEDVMIQDKRSLLIEIGPSGDSGSGTAIVIPNGNNALIILRSNVSKNSPYINELLQGIKFTESFNLSLCGK